MNESAAIRQGSAAGEGLRGPASQADQAYHLLEEAIVTLRLAPGAMVTEAQVIAIAGLGRTPVREALLRLAQQGLLGIVPRKGLVVAPVDPIDLLGVLEAREALEETVVCAAASRASAAERSLILSLARDMQQAAQAGDARLYMQRDKMLDEAMAAAGRNPYATRALEPLQTLMRRAWYAYERERDLREAAGMHLAIAQAVAMADTPAARAATESLITHMRDGLRQQVAEQDASSHL